MHFESYYAAPGNVKADHLILVGDELHHLSRVKRKKIGDVIQVVDGEGRVFESEIEEMSKSEARCRILKTRENLGEPHVSLTVAQGVLKSDRFDWFVEKATEIGVSRIIPLISERTVSSNPGSSKTRRWRRIALSAMKQCGRSVTPEVTEPLPFEQVLSLGSSADAFLIAHAGESSRPLSLSLDVKTILIVIGPEGGFTEKEVQQALDRRCASVSLGSRRLRAETAGIVFSTLILSRLREIE